MINCLHIDIEGGWGGSSASLCELIRRLDRNQVSPVVVYRKKGPAEEWYRDMGIPAYHIPEIGSFVPRATKAWKNLIVNIPNLLQLDRAANTICDIARAHRTDIIHLNYEGLFLLASRLRKKTNLPFVAHSRTILPYNSWGRWLARSLSNNVSYMFFISPQEQRRWIDLVGESGAPGEVLWNIARPTNVKRSISDPPVVVYLGNLSPAKGVDRLVDIAEVLVTRNVKIKVEVYGQDRSGKGYESELQAMISSRSLDDTIVLKGHTSKPQDVLSSAFALVRPSRDNDPWGRDVIEATAAGVPVLATGDFCGVISPGINGYLFPKFESKQFVDRLQGLLDEPSEWKRLSAGGIEIGRLKFGGESQARTFVRILRRLSGSSE